MRSVGRAVREVWRADRRGALAAAAVQLLGALAALGVVGAGKLAFDAVLDPRAGSGALVVAMLLLAAATALAGSVTVVAAQQQRMLGERVAQRVWDTILDVAGRVDVLAYESTGFATRLERVQQNAVNRPSAVTTALLGLTGGLLGTVALVAVLLQLEPLLPPVLLAAGLPAALLARRVGRLEFAFVAGVTPLVRRRFYLRQLLSQRAYATELRAYGSAPRLRGTHHEQNRTFAAALSAHVRTRQGIALLGALANGVTLAVALLAIVAFVRAGRLSLAEAGAAAIAVRLLSSQLTTAFTAVSSVLESAPFLVDLEAFDAETPPATRTGVARPLAGELVLSGVSFRYPERSEPAVREVDLCVGAGELVALVGENGSGKTTLAKIAAGLYAPDAGQIRWDGDAASIEDVRASVTVVFQDFVRYQMTVRDNVAIADPQRAADDDAIRAATEHAGFGKTLERLPDGLDAVLGREIDEGVDLSGGQWQRLALARALFRDRSLVILDEPSAALDPRAEAELFRDVRGILDGRAALLISHRFSSVRLADRIYVLADGRVVECGTHDELVARGGRYATLYALQSAAYR